MKHRNVSNEIIRLVGDADNITNLFNCITRLRLNLKDQSLADQKAIANLDGVFGVNVSGDQFQIIIGNGVSEVCDEIYDIIPRLKKVPEQQKDESSNKCEKNKVAFIMETISGIFSPIIPAIAGAGILKGILALILTFNILDKASANYQILNAISDGVFYLLPVLLAHSCSVRFKCNPYVALAIAAALFHPSLINLFAESKQSGLEISFFGLPITPASYASSVIPIILSIWLMSYVERFVDRFMPGPLKTMFVPLFTLLIVIPITLSALGPMGLFLGNNLTGGVLWLLNNMGGVAGFIIGGTMSLIIITGMHYTLVPVMVNNISTLGFDPIKILFFVSNLGQAGAAFGVFLRAKDKKLKSLALSVSFSASMGISEPAIYGVNMRLKKPFIAALIGGGVGGALAVSTGVKAYAFTMSGLPGLPALAGDTFLYAIASIVLSFGVATVLTVTLGFKEPNHEQPVKQNNKNSMVKDTSPQPLLSNTAKGEYIYAPVKGKVFDVESVSDPVFSTEISGKGLAIAPTEGLVTSPVNGVVSSIFPTKHAVAITSDNGAEILIHIGIDTVKLNGRHFSSKLKNGDTVRIGDPLVTFDLNALKDKKIDTSVIMVVTNSSDYEEIFISNQTEQSNTQDYVMQLAVSPCVA